jgi:hypothetical protein
MPKHARQYTIRNVPDAVDRGLKRKAKETGRSLNQVALDALAVGAGAAPRPKRELGEIVGSLSPREAERMDREIRLQRQVDPDLWK